MKKRIVFIVNPFSGTSKKGNFSDLVTKNIDTSKYTYQIRKTEAAGHAIELAKEAAHDGVDVVVAVGGDGSVNEVAQSLLHSESVLGVLPGGSGNGFAMHLGLGRKVKKAMNVLNTGAIKTIDTCRVNDQFFINVAGIGFDARIAYMTKQNTNRGFIPYFLTTLKESRNFKPVELEITIDGQVVKGKYAMAAVANASMFGYHFTIAPPAKLDDGLLDLVLIKEASILKYATSSYRFFNRSLHKSSVTDFFQSSNIHIKLLGEDYLHVDGEGMPVSGEMNFAVDPMSLKVLCPSDQ